MSVKVLYFAWVREKTGVAEEHVDIPDHVATVADMIGWLKTRGPEFAAAFERDDVVRAALDQAHVKHDTPLGGAREIAVVRDEILDRVVGEKIAELTVQLRREGFIGRQDQRRSLNGLDDVGDGKGLAGTRDAEQGLVRETRLQAIDQRLDRLRLIARRLITGNNLKV